MNGVATVGTFINFSRKNHIHPSDMSLVNYAVDAADRSVADAGATERLRCAASRAGLQRHANQWLMEVSQELGRTGRNTNGYVATVGCTIQWHDGCICFTSIVSKRLPWISWFMNVADYHSAAGARS